MKKEMYRAVQGKGQSGFTLIELIVVIVILGILAATALPKFTNLGGDARAASLNAVRGSLESVSAMARGRFLLSGGSTVVMEDVTVNLTQGYPTADTNLAAAAGLRADDFTVATTSAAPNTPTINTGQIAIIPDSVAGTTAGATCYVLYSQATASAATPPVITPPQITVVTTGC